MGDSLTLELSIDAGEARAFAEAFDQLHLRPNPVLPEGAVSGLYVASVFNRALLERPEWAGLVCATGLRYEFCAPVLPGPLTAKVRWNDGKRRRRFSAMLGPGPAVVVQGVLVMRFFSGGGWMKRGWARQYVGG